MNGAQSAKGFPVEEFVQALTAQLDRAQDALALKARTGRPLTFALKDLSVDLKVFWESQQDGRLLLRHAGPNETGASTVHLAFTTITRSMVEENTLSLSHDSDPRSLNELGRDGFGDEERRRLELVGVRTVGQFRELSQATDPRHMEALIGIPVNRLRAALERSAAPAVVGHAVEQGPGRRPLLRIQGANLSNGEPPQVRIAGEPVEVLESGPSEVLVRPMSHQTEGQFEVQVGSKRATGFFALEPEPEELAS